MAQLGKMRGYNQILSATWWYSDVLDAKMYEKNTLVAHGTVAVVIEPVNLDLYQNSPTMNVRYSVSPADLIWWHGLQDTLRLRVLT